MKRSLTEFMQEMDRVHLEHWSSAGRSLLQVVAWLIEGFTDSWIEHEDISARLKALEKIVADSTAADSKAIWREPTTSRTPSRPKFYPKINEPFDFDRYNGVTK